MMDSRHMRCAAILLLLAGMCALPAVGQEAPAKKANPPADGAKADGKPESSGPQQAVDGAPELTAEASRAIDKGLAFLLATQRPDGSWDSDGKGTRAVAITSLSLMAFMSKAQFPGSGPYGKPLDRGKAWLLKKAKVAPNGYLGSTMYEHGLATLALSEMWGMTRDAADDDAIQKALEAAVEVIVRSQNPGGGWRYQPQMNAGQDTSVTVMVFVALASARQAGVVVPDVTIRKFLAYLKLARADGGGFTYTPRTKTTPTVACSAGGAYAAQLAGQRDSEMVSAAIRYLQKQSAGIIDGGCGHYYYAHYYAIQAMVQTGDEEYAKWYPRIRDALIRRQQANGSWDKGKQGGAGYATPMAIIILATPHRYIPIYQR